jgi:hypothetical protein
VCLATGGVSDRGEYGGLCVLEVGVEAEEDGQEGSDLRYYTGRGMHRSPSGDSPRPMTGASPRGR